MRRGEFEDIFEECLSALLEGRRSIGESLSLYPAWKGQLEPLLRAAEEMAACLNQAPPPHVRARGLQRFLEAATAKRRLREVFSPQETVIPWWRWAPAAMAAVFAVGVLALMSATLMAEDGQTLSDPVSVMLYTPTPEPTAAPTPVETALERVREQVAVLEDVVRDGEPVEVVLLEELEEASSELAADLDGGGGMELAERRTAVSVVSKQYELLQTLQKEASGVQARAVAASLAAAEEVLEMLGATPMPQPTPSPELTPSPAATPSPGPSPTPTEAEGATPSATPTPAE